MVDRQAYGQRVHGFPALVQHRSLQVMAGVRALRLSSRFTNLNLYVLMR